ncbi:hypothetical protein ES319_A04G025700v1 [Gossypium barbadense]|uniref:Reverse transcriptase zinc-binding domain-containing protein n=2 Tax=Gossypium TaxID=3633 RepID=A0A5J5W2Q5_GOSBA|nr:hypothetical protein ES319_A04G025700v1 [Gossypium barbadense]TYH21273.1 hypothetical protein ES288_A04G030500v1 [Gossypium darwinii]
MSLFCALVTVIKRIDKIKRNFLWRSIDGKKKMVKIRWNVICNPKVKGGAGVVNLGVKNKALLAKWSWRFAVEKEVLWRKVILAKYGSNVQCWRFKTTCPKNMYSIWKGIVVNSMDAAVSRCVGEDSFYWKIGNGKTALFWWDKWCGDRPLKWIYPRLFRIAKSKDCTIAEMVSLLGSGNTNWNEYFTRPLLEREVGLSKELAERVIGIDLNLSREDRLCWVKDKEWVFSVKKCTELLMLEDGEINNFDFGILWNIKVPPRVHSFLWILVIDRLPTKEFLVKRGVCFQKFSLNCPWCEGVPECTSHLFFQCKFIDGFWGRIFKWWAEVWKPVEGFSDFFVLCNNVCMNAFRKRLWLIAIAVACWTIWLARNGMIFDKKRVYMENLVFL